MDHQRPEDRESMQDYFEHLSPEGRREHIYLKPEFRDAYNEITEAHRIFVLPQYYFRHWRHVLGPVAHTLYEELRRRTYYNPQTGERRDSFYATQQELADAIGLKDRKTARKALAALEGHGFISRKTRHYTNPKTNRPYRGADEITVYFEIPLTTEDAVNLLLRSTTEDTAVLGKKSPVRPRSPREDVDKSVVKGKKSPIRAGEKIPSNVSTTTSTLSNNVRVPSDQRTLRQHPSVRQLPADVVADREQLAQEIGRQLYIMEGNRDLPDGEHKSLGFHRRVAYLMPSELVHEALAATRDAIEDQRSGRKTLSEVAAYFAGIVQNVAERERIDLGVAWKDKPPTETR